ncbi:unnamed protein product, partial [Onchocerca ochengi]|uniref:Uncharacterized protein n=1 Tax=Onchocerca ochengi TaxID=42157 RepID=A0A5K4T392_ONCOC
MWYAEYA